jgi:hypothetical protein
MTAMTEDATADRAADRHEAAALVLYVSPGSHACAKARTNLAAILERYGAQRVRYEVCDVSREPMRAEADRILFTPTLVLKAAVTPAWIVGDLSNQAAVVQLLRTAGIEEPS